MIKDPRTREFCEHGDTFNGWIGPDVHFLFSTIKGGRDCCWVLTHRDEHDIDESWSFPGRLEDVYKVLEGWDPTCRAIVEKTPSLVDWKLVYRDPLPTWVSKHARILLLGDAAHPFLPTSAQGATQAMEDGVTIAVCLRRAGKANVPAAVRTASGDPVCWIYCGAKDGRDHAGPLAQDGLGQGGPGPQEHRVPARGLDPQVRRREARRGRV
ncbi:hypothetical protein VTK56DRAFT_841 [Thermocarpiscus australiensis]